MGEPPSAVKDTVLSSFGTMTAMGHVGAGDEVLKNAMANLAFENSEIAACTSLTAAASAAQSMPAVTERFIALQETGETASR